jgi:glycosyltransferase involved in cell wall biosynthesis
VPELTGKPLRILYVGWANHVHFQRWAEYFAAAGHQVWVLPVTPGRVRGARTLPFLTRGKRESFQKLELRLYDTLCRFDLVHVHWAGFAHLPFSAGLRPYAVTAWGSDIYKISQYTPREQEQMGEALRSASFVTVDSEDQKFALEKLGVASSRVKVVQWGVDTGLFRPCPKDPALCREIGVEGRRVIYSPRNLAPIYNNDAILRAVSILRERYPDVVLVQKHYNCSQEQIDEYLASAEKIGMRDSVRLVGTMEYEKLPLFYGLADAVVSVPSSDGTPMSVLEAMACGVVPVVSDLPSLREWITDGYNGYFAPLKDDRQLADKLALVLGDPTWCAEVSKRNLAIVAQRADHHANMKVSEQYCREAVASL